MALLTLRVFLSSPGDVAVERVIARRVVGRLNAEFAELVEIEPIVWERVALVATASFQEQLVRPSDADIALVILWGRLGTPLPSHIRRPDGTTYASGTEYEFEDAIAGYRRSGRPQVVAYRKTAPVPVPDALDALEESVRQREALERFVSTWFRSDDGTLKGAFHDFAQPADFEDLLEIHLRQLVESRLPAGVTGRRAATWRGASPFRGLEAFQPEHAPVFFGRTAAVAAVVSRLRAQAAAGRAFVLVVGMSGGGKSSLVRAGVLPLVLQPGVLGAATAWRSAVMRPSDGAGRPVDALERAVAAALDRDRGSAAGDEAQIVDDATIERTPSDDAASFAGRTVARLDAATADASPSSDGDPPRVDLIVAIDQLEEAFSDERIAAPERDAFFAALDALARSGRVWIVATMRSDAYPTIAGSPTLIALKEGDGQFDLLPPNVREIGQIIRFPAAAAGLRFEVGPTNGERLDDVIRDAAAKNPGALPLLQFLLEALYQRRNDEDMLTFRAYDELGGVEGALAQRAEAVFAGVSQAAQDALPAVLRELVTYAADDESKPLRRVAPKHAFRTAAAVELVDALLDARLLVATLDEHGEAAISLAHESLLEFWPRVRAWRDDDRELLLIHARVAAAARSWDKEGRSADLLLARGKPLAEAKRLADADIRLDATESALLAASERRARRFARVRAGAIASLAALTVIAGLAAWKANVESGRARVQATTAQRTTDFMVGLFANADPDRTQGDKVTVRQVLDQGVIQIDRELADETVVRANLRRAMGQAYDGLGLYDKAKDVLDRALADSIHDGRPDDVLAGSMALAWDRLQAGDYPKAEALYRSALDQARSRRDDRSQTIAQAQAGLADSLSEQGQWEESESLFVAALATLARIHPQGDLATALALDAYARMLYARGNLDGARSLFERSLTVRKSLFGDRDTKVALALNNLGALDYQIGRFDEARQAWTEALPIFRDVFGPNYRLVGALLNNLGRVELLRNELSPAQAHLTESLTIERGALAPMHEDLILPLNSLALVRLAEGRSDDASKLIGEAMEIAVPRKHWMLNQLAVTRADIAIAEGRYADASGDLNDARALLRGQYGDKLLSSDAWRLAVVELSEATLRLRRGDPDDARRRLNDALPALRQHFGDRGFYPDRALKQLIAAANELGDTESSRRYQVMLAARGA